MTDAISLGIGEPDFVTPWHIRDAGIYSLERGHTKYTSNAGMAEDTVTVGSEEYFVIGDNPDSSEDSRYTDIGNVKLSDIEGKAWYVLSPRARRGKL